MVIGPGAAQHLIRLMSYQDICKKSELANLVKDDKVPEHACMIYNKGMVMRQTHALGKLLYYVIIKLYIIM